MSKTDDRWLVRDRLEPEHHDALVELFQTAWWTRGRQLADVVRMLAGCDGVVSAVRRADGALVGFARFVTDGVYKATIYDLIVAERERGDGLGALVMDAVLAHPGLAGVAHTELYCLPELRGFYAPWGFTDELGGVGLLRRES